jgi:hypothetical protein
MMTTKILSWDDDRNDLPDDLVDALVVESTAYVYPDRPVRYPPDTARFEVWVRDQVARAGLPDRAADLLIALAISDEVDVYPNIVTGEVVICPADLMTWQRSHDANRDEPRQSLAQWWEAQS